MKLYTDKAVANWLALTDRRVRQLRDEGVIREYAPGLYDMRDAVTRYILFLRKGANRSDLNDERAMLTRAKREAADMENAVRRNNLHTTEDVERGVAALCLNIRTRFSALPAKLSREIANMDAPSQADLFDLLKAAVDEILADLSNYDVALAASDDEPSSEEPDAQMSKGAEGSDDAQGSMGGEPATNAKGSKERDGVR